MSLELHALLEAVFESTADGLLVVDLNGKVIRSNSHFQHMWKIPDEVLSSGNDYKLLEFIVDQLRDPATFINKVQELYQNHDSISADTIAFKDGRYFARHSRPLKSDGKTVGRVWSFLDITKQKQSEEVFRAITEISPDIISILSPEGILIFNSEAAERIHGHKNSDLIGKSTFEFIHPDDQSICQQEMANLLSGKERFVSVQYRYRNARNEYDFMEATASNEINNPLIKGIVVISREIGHRKRLEDELQQALKNLENFISIASHELKTPVTGIKLQLQMLERGGITFEANGKRSTDISALIRQVNSLDRLIEDLLQVSRIRRGNFRYEFQLENFSEIISENTKRFESLLTHSGCQLTTIIQPELFLNCDRTRIEQVLINLVSNIVRYAPGKPVSMSLKKSGTFAELRVTDNGPGIDAEKISRIFLPFAAGPEKHRHDGLGVGLYISRSIVEQHSGDLTIEDSSPTGTTFLLRLPLKA